MPAMRELATLVLAVLPAIRGSIVVAGGLVMTAWRAA
jgi:hypothetical protein